MSLLSLVSSSALEWSTLLSTISTESTSSVTGLSTEFAEICSPALMCACHTALQLQVRLPSASHWRQARRFRKRKFTQHCTGVGNERVAIVIHLDRTLRVSTSTVYCAEPACMPMQTQSTANHPKKKSDTPSELCATDPSLATPRSDLQSQSTAERRCI